MVASFQAGLELYWNRARVGAFKKLTTLEYDGHRGGLTLACSLIISLIQIE